MKRNSVSLGAAVAMALVATSAKAWDCSYWSQSSNPAAECYKAPAQPSSLANEQGQAQGQAQGQKQTANGGTATGGAANSVSQGGRSSSASHSSSSVGTVASGSQSAAGINSDTVTENSGNTTYREAASVVQPAAMFIQGCQVVGQAGGSNTRAAAMLGIGFTPKSCYDYIQAQAYLAIGARQAACEILNHTEAAKRAVANGAVLPVCEAQVKIVVQQTPGTYTAEQVDLIVKKAIRK